MIVLETALGVTKIIVGSLQSELSRTTRSFNYTGYVKLILLPHRVADHIGPTVILVNSQGFFLIRGHRAISLLVTF